MSLITAIDSNFMPGFRVFWKSFISFNPWFDLDFIILDLGLLDKHITELKNTYKKIEIRNIKKENYENINMSMTRERLKKTYYKIDVFNQIDQKRLIFIDMDTLILGDISEIFKFKGKFGACQIYVSRTDSFGKEINSGVFVINNTSKKIYDGLLEIAKYGLTMTDQEAINKYFRGKVTYLSKIYNVEKRMLHSKNKKDIFNKKRILHFVASKPWERLKPNKRELMYKSLERLWHDFN